MLESNYNTLAILGNQWGDEGKGHLVDFYASKWADVVVRSQGGNNAGHTIVFNGEKFAVRSLPSGVFNKNVINIVGNGCVIDPIQMVNEIDGIQKRGITDFNLIISPHAHVITDYHRMLDNNIEDTRLNKVKTTGNGIGPCYADKKYRLGIRICDIINGDEDHVVNLIQDAVCCHDLCFDDDYIYKLSEELCKAGSKIKQYIGDCSEILNQYIQEGKKILFEGAQAAMLDNDYGFYPYVTSSNPTAAGIAPGCGIAPKYIDNVLGIVKAYSTRVGAGPFVTEIEKQSLADKIRETGHEYGTVTGRPRRIGWLDLPVLKLANRLNGTTGIAITLLDVLTGIEELNVCTDYLDADGNVLTSIPASLDILDKCKPVYTILKGWSEDITQCKTYKDLPIEARNYIEFIEKQLDVDVEYISVGPDRNQIISK